MTYEDTIKHRKECEITMKKNILLQATFMVIVDQTVTFGAEKDTVEERFDNCILTRAKSDEVRGKSAYMGNYFP